jgi:hypothetical protein
MGGGYPPRRGGTSVGELPPTGGVAETQFFWNPGTQKTEVYPGSGGVPPGSGGVPEIGVFGGTPKSGVPGGVPQNRGFRGGSPISGFSGVPRNRGSGGYPEIGVPGGVPRNRGPGGGPVSVLKSGVPDLSKFGVRGGPKSQKNGVLGGSKFSTFVEFCVRGHRWRAGVSKYWYSRCTIKKVLPKSVFFTFF